MTNDFKEMQEHFKQHKYVVIKGFLDKKTADLFYQYSKVKVQRTDFMSTYAPESYNSIWEGGFDDGQVDQSFYSYGDPLMDSLLLLATDAVSNFTGIELLPQYSYWRFYQLNNVLARHIDRESCEISATMCLGYDVSNVDANRYPNYNWPMFVNDKRFDQGAPIRLEPGDMIVYRGCEVEHWREAFLGLNQAQVFLHFNDKHGPFQNILDGRPILGVPKTFQRQK